MKKILSVALVLTLLLGTLCIFPASAEELPEGQISGDYWYNVLDDGTAEITGYEGNDDIINVPAEIEGYTVTSIGYKTFLSSTATEVYLPDTVTCIKSFAFRIMRNLKNIVIPESVTVIEQGAFEYCESLSSITLPKALESLGRKVLKDTPYYQATENWENGMLYSGNYLIAADESLSGVCEIKEGTTLIADYAFENCTEITGFVLPQSLKHIGYESFSSCRKVKEIILPESVVSIDDYAFFDCQALESITLPETLEKIGIDILDDTSYYNNPDNWHDNVLYTGNALISVDENIKAECKIKDGTYIIATHAFCGTANLISLIMPDSVRYIGEASFGWCYDLEYIRFSKNLTEIPDDAFIACTSLSNITIPENIVKIGNEAFSNCRSLKSVIVPESVTEIGSFAFDYDYHPDSFKLYGKKGSTAEEYAKANDIPFEEINENYKDKVLALLNITDPNFYIEEYEHFSTADESTPDYVLISAYDAWDSHTTVTKNFGDYILHSTNMSPGDGFGYYIYLPDTNEVYTISEAFDNGIPDVYSLFTEGIIGELTGDANNDNRLSIQDATIIQKQIAGLEYIQYYFSENNFTDLVADYNRDGELNIRDATAIQKHLAGLGIYDSIDEDFENNDNNKIKSGEFVYTILDDGTASIGSGNPEAEGIVIIPNKIDGYTVTEIANNGFCGTNITEVVIPDTVTRLNDYAFSDNHKLKNVNIPTGVTSLGEAVFKNCDSLREIFIPASVTDIGLCAIGYEDNYVDNDGVMLPDGGYIEGTPVTIEGYSGTAAEIYAKEHRFAFVDITPKYKDEVLTLLDIPEEDPENGGGWLAYYHEGYEYYSDSSDNEATPDYVLIEVYENVSGPAFAAKVFGDYVLRNYEHKFPATFGYFIYLPKTNEIYSLQEAYNMELEGIYNVFTEGGIGELIGDVNYDGKLNIRDATLIQKDLAGIEKIENNSIEAFVYTEDENVPTSIGDYNRDGKMNIRDATAIQKHLAGLDIIEPEYTVLEISEVTSAGSYNSVKTIARNRTQLKNALAKITETVGPFEPDDKFNDEYFEENSVIVIADIIGGSCCSQLIDNVKISGTTLTVSRFMDYHGVHTDDINYQLVLIEASKEQVKIISEIEVIDLYVLVCY